MKYWKFLNPDGSIKSVQSLSTDFQIPGAVEITETEFNAFLAGLPPPLPPPPTPDWKALWLAADTVAKKVAVIAKRLELE